MKPSYSFEEFKRPASKIDGDLAFQVVDVDYSTEKYVENFTPIMDGRSPIIRLFGVTDKGNSVACIVHGFYPYTYIEANRRVSLEECEAIKDILDDAVKDDHTLKSWSPEHVLSVEPMEKINIFGYRTKTSQYLKVTMMIPKFVPVLKRLIENGKIEFSSLPNLNISRITFESSLAFVTRFMCDAKINCGGWIRLKQGEFAPVSKKNTNTQIEVNVMHTNVHCFQEDDIAPWRFMYFDIECDGRPGHFPEAIMDPVCTISAYLVEYGKKNSARKIRFQLNTCDSTPGVTLCQFENERDMLKSFREFIVEYDPDVMLGWNILTFDFPYLAERAATLGLTDFKKFSRVFDYEVSIRDDTFESKAYGKRNSKKITCAGRVPFDMMVYVMREKKYRSYSLNAISGVLLNKSKIDLNHKLIHVYQHADSSKRKIIGDYCDWDSYLPYEIGEKLAAFTNCLGMLSVCKITMNMLLTQGQQVKMMALIHSFANPEGYIIPTIPNEDKAEQSEGKVYEGAVVIEPIRGYYDENSPVVTLDFSSLYPSIMMAHNLCYSTLISPSEWAEHDSSIYHTTPYNNCRFVNTSVKKGILPRILEEVVGKRKAVRKELDKETDPLRKAVLDGRQLALKTTANSLYGFTGATVGKLPCLDISASVTAYGREMIMQTKKYIEENYTIAKGKKNDAEVIYGDTDSTMVIFRRFEPIGDDVSKEEKEKETKRRILEVSEMGIEACELISREFQKPVKLEFEKVYSPYLLLMKKRYAGLKWTKNDLDELVFKVDVKGMESVRRDSCLLVKILQDKVLHSMIVEKNVEKAKQQCKDCFSDLVKGKIDVSQLVITKSLSKPGDEYKTKQIHVEMIKRIIERDPSFNYSIGDRIPYVMIKKDFKETKKCEMSEHPLYVIENNLRIDYQFYLNNQLKGPIERVFQYVVKDMNELFSGAHMDHTNRIGEGEDPTKNTISKYFTKKVEQCLFCKVSIPGDSSKKRPLCTHCNDEEGKNAKKIYLQEMDNLREAEQRNSFTWSICRTCKLDSGGRMLEPDTCDNMDCVVLFARTKAEKELNIINERVRRFMDW